MGRVVGGDGVGPPSKPAQTSPEPCPLLMMRIRSRSFVCGSSLPDLQGGRMCGDTVECDGSQVSVCFIGSLCSNAETGSCALSGVTRAYLQSVTARNTLPVLRHRVASVASSIAPCCLLQNHCGRCVSSVCVCVCTYFYVDTDTQSVLEAKLQGTLIISIVLKKSQFSRSSLFLFNKRSSQLGAN